MDRLRTALGGIGSSNSVGFAGIIAFIIVVIIVLVYSIKHIASVQLSTATSSNIKRIRDAEYTRLMDQYGYYYNNIKVGNIWSGVPDKQKLLINTNMTGCRLAGYLGPFTDGVFSGDQAIDTVLRTGARVLFIEIDRKKDDPSKPSLVYRDSDGYIRSLNSISIKSVAKAIKDRAFSTASSSVPSDVREMPIVVVLYFYKTPDRVKAPREYILFLQEVSKQIQDLSPYLLAETPQGDFRRQQLDRELFFKPMQVYKNKIILLTNVDTAIMRSYYQYGINGLENGGDLDLHVNARLYTQQTTSSFGATTTVGGTSQPAAIIASPDYFLKMPDSARTDLLLLTKSAFVICMNPDPTKNIEKKDLDSLITDYGVHCVPFVHFKKMDELKPYFGIGNLYEKSSILAKLKQLQFVPPEPIVTRQPSQAMDTRGGFIQLGKY